MAQAAAPANDRKRVKVYELKNNDWFDRGTGFCTGRLVNVSIVLCCVVLRCVGVANVPRATTSSTHHTVSSY
jgi:hypothetical protein